VTFAVLLAFVAMLAWDGFNKAKAAAYTEAATILDVYNASVGLAGPETSQIRDAIIGYLETVVRVEWPAQAEGQIVDRGKAYLEKLNTLAIGLKPLTPSFCNPWRGYGTRGNRDCWLPKLLFLPSSGS
jgi:hypothetical protein